MRGFTRWTKIEPTGAGKCFICQGAPIPHPHDDSSPLQRTFPSKREILIDVLITLGRIRFNRQYFFTLLS